MKVLITGASGFVGSSLLSKFANYPNIHAVGVTTNSNYINQKKLRYIFINELSNDNIWQKLLHGVDVVVHCAAKVHAMNYPSPNEICEYRKINFDYTLYVAKKAAEAGVKRFIFLSSIKVNGESTQPNQPFKSSDLATPADFYAASKYDAENALFEFSNISGLEVVIIRPPLIYGPGVKANFLKMMSYMHAGIPIPLASICKNKRSLVSIDNLYSLIFLCLDHSAAVNQVFFVSDDEDISTAELLIRLGDAMNRRVILVPVPLSILKFGGLILGKSDYLQKLCDSLQVDISKTKAHLNWRPPLSLNDGLRITAEWWLKHR